MKFEIRSRWSDAVQFTAEINCAGDASTRIKAGLAVRWARKTDADLTGADLTGADLTAVRADFYDVLLRAIPEVPDLLATLRAGKINGSTYTGRCACLAGTIAKTRGVSVDDLGFANASRPAERWFLAIREGDTPETNAVARVTEGWIIDFIGFVGMKETA